MRRNRVLLIVVVLALALFAAACGGDSPSESSAGAAEIPSGVDPEKVIEIAGDAQPENACSLITDAEITELTGLAPTLSDGDALTAAYATCGWSNGTTDFFTLTIQSEYDWAQISGSSAASAGRTAFRDLDGLGDRAFVEYERAVVVEQDGKLVTLGGNILNIEDLENLTRIVLDRLG